MSFSRLRRKLELSQSSRNGTAINATSSLTELPTTILETLIPGYSLISGFILDAFGFDVSILVSAAVIIFAAVHVGTYIWQRVFSWFKQYLMSNIYIDDGDDLFDSILAWIGEQQMARESRSIKAVTRYTQTFSEDEADENAALDENGIFHYGKYAARQPPRYEPYFGTHRFWHKGSLFLFDRSRREVQSNPWSGRGSDEQLIKLSCIGRSTDPLRELLTDIKARSLEKQQSLTNIRRPAPKELSRGRAGAWDRASSRPSRPMETVSLDKDQKTRIVADINEYLHPASPHWYASRGIPWRRGYLFHGPPGTGKSSLSFALAGLFGLDIYVISLLEPTLTEGDLNRLFSNLPRRCIVLLEDIDSAGLVRDDKSDKDDETSKSEGDDAQITAKDLAKALKTASRKEGKSDDTKQGISLSGLLNAIDGVASHEGRVLVMTTNHPEKLDGALIRPGRVDLQVKFGLATRDQMRDIFIRMYSNEFKNAESSMRSLRDHNEEGQKTPLTNCLTSGFNGTHSLTNSDFNHVYEKLPNGQSNGTLTPQVNGIFNGNMTNGVPKTSGITPFLPKAGTEEISREELRSMGEAFAAKLPIDTFSPAEIQGFLLIRKKEPRKALEDVEEWRVGMLEAKEKKSKVVVVQ